MSMTIKVIDHEITVKIEDPWSWDLNKVGNSNFAKGIIIVDGSMPVDAIRSTFLHELIHIIAALNSIELTEQSVDGLAIGIHSFIKNNPNWMDQIK